MAGNNTTLHPAFQQLIAESPWRASALIPGETSRVFTVEELASQEMMTRFVESAARRFPMNNTRWEAQLWWFGFLNAVLHPGLAVAVEHDEAVSFDLSAGTLFVCTTEKTADEQPYYWCGFQPQVEDDPDEEFFIRQGESLGKNLAPAVATLSAVSGVKPAPLWAVVVDAIVAGCASAGNSSFEFARAAEIADQLHTGMAQALDGVKLPRPRMIGVVDGQVDEDLPRGEELDELDVHLACRRVSCCMIYHLEGSGKCISCPKKTPQEKQDDLLEYVDSLG